MELETDANGVITFMPLLRWGVSIVDGKLVGLAIDYYASAEAAAAQRPSRVQLHLDATAAKDMAKVLNSRGDMILGGTQPGG
jgi:hypothetical protein